MILGFKKYMGQLPTRFKEQILASVGFSTKEYGVKLHSIRAGKRWKAGDTIHMAYGVRTSQYEQFNKGIDALSKCVSVQEIYMTWNGKNLQMTVDDKYLMQHWIELLIKNDGLTREQFISWFFPDGEGYFLGQIIHWTKLKY